MFDDYQYVFKEIFLKQHDPNDILPLDHRFISKLIPLVEVLKFYFRAEVQGIENVIDGKALVVGNHNAGTTFLEPYFMGLEWYRKRPDDLPYFLTHDLLFNIPFLKNILKKTLGIKASHKTANNVFNLGKKVAVFPGGNYEAFRPFSKRHCIDFGGHKGFIKLALKANVPIIPVANKGGHHTFFVLAQGRHLAKRLGFKKYLRSDSFPIFIGLPWGIGVGPIFHLPLPAKLSVKIGKPIMLSPYTHEDAGNPETIDKIYELVIDQIQKLYDSIDF